MATLTLKKKPAATTGRSGPHDGPRRAPVRGHAAARQRPTLEQAQQSRAEREAQRGAPVTVTRREPGSDGGGSFRRDDRGPGGPRRDSDAVRREFAPRRDEGFRHGPDGPGNSFRHDAPRRDDERRGPSGPRRDDRGPGGPSPRRDGPPRDAAGGGGFRRDEQRPFRDDQARRGGGFGGPGGDRPAPRFQDRGRDERQAPWGDRGERGDARPPRDGGGYRGPRADTGFRHQGGDRPRHGGGDEHGQGPRWPDQREPYGRGRPEGGPRFDRDREPAFDRGDRGDRGPAPWGDQRPRPQGPGGYPPRQDDRRRTSASPDHPPRRAFDGPPDVAARRAVPEHRPGPQQRPADRRPGPYPREDRPARAERPERVERERPEPTGTGDRLSKRLGELGLASRREADDWIAEGWVRVDGKVAILGQRVAKDAVIDIDPAAHQHQAQRVTILLNKPIGYVSGQAEDGYEPAAVLVQAGNRWADDPSGLKFHPGHSRGLAPAGRLDIDSTGLLILTQDGRVARQLIGEDSTIEKEYLVRVEMVNPPVVEGEEAPAPMHHFPAEQLALLEHGLELDGVKLKPARVSWANEDQLRFVLREGRKRQIRRMCEAVGLKVTGLKRVRIGRIPLGHLPAGQWRYLSPWERF